MERRRTVGRYRLIDLGMWLMMLLVFETVVLKAATRWFPAQAYYVSVVPAISAIVYMRWGAWGIVHAVLGGVVTGVNLRLGRTGVLIYTLGNALSVGALGLIRLMGSDAVRTDAVRTMLYGFAVFALMLAGKALAGLVFRMDASLGRMLLRFAPEIITLLFTEVVLWIARRQDGVFEPQREYLKRIQKQQEQERGENP